MKKIITGAFIAVFLSLGLTSVLSVPAFAADPALGISGIVIDKDTNKPVAGARIQVSCDGVLVLDAITEANGNYNVPPDSRCKVGGTLTITATKGDKSDAYTTKDMKDFNVIDLKLKKRVNIPEYGWLGGILAGSVAIGTIVFIRRRNANMI